MPDVARGQAFCAPSGHAPRHQAGQLPCIFVQRDVVSEREADGLLKFEKRQLVDDRYDVEKGNGTPTYMAPEEMRD